MAFIVAYDANATYGNTPRDLLIRIGRAGLVQAKWTVQRYGSGDCRVSVAADRCERLVVDHMPGADQAREPDGRGLDHVGSGRWRLRGRRG